MADPIVIQFLSGPNLGQRQRFTEAPVTFGRDPDNTLVLAEPFVSRRHGMLTLDNDRWAMVNQSPNGTRVNARLITTVGGKPRRLRSGDTVAVGNQPVFTVMIEAATAVEGEESHADAAAHKKLSGRSKVWIGIGVYMLIMVGLFVFLTTLGGGNKGSNTQRPHELTERAVESEIMAALPKAQPPNPDAAARHLQEARQWYARRDTDEHANFRAHLEYKRSLAAANKLAFDQGLDTQRFQEVEKALTNQIRSLYFQGVNQLASGNHEGAVVTFDRLLGVYTDNDSTIYRNTLALRDYAASLRRKR